MRCGQEWAMEWPGGIRVCPGSHGVTRDDRKVWPEVNQDVTRKPQEVRRDDALYRASGSDRSA